MGGSWTYTYNLLKHLKEISADDEITVCVGKSVAESFRGIGVQVEAVDVDVSNRLRRIGWEQWQLPRLASARSASIVHGTANVLPMNVSCRTVVTIHDFQYCHYPENFTLARRQYLRLAVPHTLKVADRVICVSEATKQEALQTCRVAESKLRVIHEAGLSNGEKELIVKERPGDDRLDGPYVLSVGSALPHKNLERLLRAFSKIQTSIPHDLWIIGEPFAFGTRLEQMCAESLGTGKKRVRFLGFVSREALVQYYKNADAFVFPSMFEGFGIPAVEAMECGCPVIAAHATSLPEVVGDAGIYFDPQSIDDMASAMRRTCLDSPLRMKMRQLSLERAKAFSWRTMASQTLEVYRQAARTRPHL